MDAVRWWDGGGVGQLRIGDQPVRSDDRGQRHFSAVLPDGLAALFADVWILVHLRPATW